MNQPRRHPRARLAAALALLLLVARGPAGVPLRADESHWDLIRPAGTLPPGLRMAAQTHDPGRNRLLFFGGIDSDGIADRLHALDLGTDTWLNLRPRGTAPSSRDRAAMAFDPAGDRAVLFSGYNGGSLYLDETLFLDFSDARGPEWRKLPFTPSKPAPRLGASLVHVPAAAGPGRLLLFGGWNGAERRSYQDVWALSLEPGKEAWVRLSPAGSAPPARDGHLAVVDQARSRMLVYGGWSRQRTEVTLDDLWELDLRPGQERWAQLSPPSPRPPVQAWMSGVIDDCPDRRRLLMFGGWNGSADNAFTWALGLDGDAAWARLDPSGAKPRPRDSHVAAFDSARRRMVIFGGWENEAELLRDTWQLGLAPCGGPAPSLTPPSAPTPTRTATPRPGGSPTVEPTPTQGPSASATPDLVSTRVALTLTALAPSPTASTTPDLRTAVAQTLTALAPSPTVSATPDLVGTIVAGTQTALAPSATPSPNLVLTRIAATLTALAQPPTATVQAAGRLWLPRLARPDGSAAPARR